MPITNPAAVTVSNAAVVVAEANPLRKRLIITQTSANAVRVGTSTVSTSTGFRLGQNERYVLDGANCPTDAIYAIREGGSDGTVCVVEFTAD
jgi:hypothetical protein